MTRADFSEFVASTCSDALHHPKKKKRELAIKMLGALTLATIFEREAWSEKDIDYGLTGAGNEVKPSQHMEDTLVAPETNTQGPTITINEEAHGHHDPDPTPTPAPAGFYPDEQAQPYEPTPADEIVPDPICDVRPAPRLRAGASRE